ncbi:MAG: hypothetical protein U0359_28785 [Byssovorax sp.]
MGFERTVPKNSSELQDYMLKLHESKSHVKSVKINQSNAHLEVDLDWLANTKFPDVYMPIKRARLHDATELLAKILRESNNGFPPSNADVQALFDMIDPAGQ